MEDLEKQFITSCKSLLTQEGKEICEEVLVMIGEKDEMMMEKAKAFCEFFLSYKLEGVEDSELKEKCKKYLDYLVDFERYNHAIKSIERERKEKLDLGGRRIRNL